jgi:hypothetical protein
VEGRLVTPAEQMRERAAEEAVRASQGVSLIVAEAMEDLAAAIRALPLPEEAAPTAQEKLRRVREAATYRVATVHGRRVYAAPEAKNMLGWWFQWNTSGLWVGRTMVAAGSNVACPSHATEEAARTWVLDTLRAEGWDVVEEGSVQDG